MNHLPLELKCLICDYLFKPVETYNQLVPSEASDEAYSDMQLVCKVRVLCNGDGSFLKDRFKVTHVIDKLAINQARRNLVFSILRFKHMDCMLFRLPRLKREVTSHRSFFERYINTCTKDSLLMHVNKLSKLNDDVSFLRLRQKRIRRLLKRDHEISRVTSDDKLMTLDSSPCASRTKAASLWTYIRTTG